MFSMSDEHSDRGNLFDDHTSPLVTPGICYVRLVCLVSNLHTGLFCELASELLLVLFFGSVISSFVNEKSWESVMCLSN